MDDYTKKYTIIIGCSLLVLILEAFLFRFTGILGLILCIASIYFVIGSIIKLLKTTDLVKKDILDKIDILFFLK